MAIPRILEPEVMSGAEEASQYDEMDFSVTDDAFAQRAAQMASLGHVDTEAPIDWILDLGAGNAKIPLAACDLLRGATRICAVDMSFEMLRVGARNRAKAPSGVRLRLLQADGKRLPFADRSVGMVTSNSLIHHIPDPLDVFKEIARVARPGARILIRDLVRPETQADLDEIVTRHATTWSPLQRKLFDDSLHAALTVDEVHIIADQAGLKGFRVSQITDRHWSLER
jgi:ubiquinone/menaquinone biosynthesis C-methylase UbiE